VIADVRESVATCITCYDEQEAHALNKVRVGIAQGGSMRRGNRVVARELEAFRQSLRHLDLALTRLVEKVVSQSNGAQTSLDERLVRKLTISPSRRRALQLHGRYMGYVRQLRPRAKAEVRVLRAKKGVRAAIVRAKRLASA
jgi:hypothetical protein